MTENNIEFITNDDTATVTFSQARYISRILKLSKQDDGCEIIALPEHNGGYLCARIPVEWVKISPKRRLSDEARERAAERARLNFGQNTSIVIEEDDQ